MRQSERSKPNLLPRFPRLNRQRLMRESERNLDRDDPDLSFFFASGRHGMPVMLPAQRSR